MNNVYLIGFMGAGKTTVGRKLAAALDCTYVDLDQEIEERAGMSIPQIFSEKGESGFRLLESECLRQNSMDTEKVVATGGGVVEKVENIDLMNATGMSVFLDVELETLLDRIGENDTRPLAQRHNDWATTRELFASRIPLYRRADYIVDANGKSVDETVLEILTRLKQ